MHVLLAMVDPLQAPLPEVETARLLLHAPELNHMQGPMQAMVQVQEPVLELHCWPIPPDVGRTLLSLAEVFLSVLPVSPHSFAYGCLAVLLCCCV